MIAAYCFISFSFAVPLPPQRLSSVGVPRSLGAEKKQQGRLAEFPRVLGSFSFDGPWGRILDSSLQTDGGYLSKPMGDAYETRAYLHCLGCLPGLSGPGSQHRVA